LWVLDPVAISCSSVVCLWAVESVVGRLPGAFSFAKSVVSLVVMSMLLFGERDAELKIALWYHSSEANSWTPLVLYG
jgi:hypothetical protein